MKNFMINKKLLFILRVYKLIMNLNRISLYRAVSEEEIISVRMNNAFIPHPEHMAGKWFAENVYDAVKWGKLFYTWDQKTFYIILIKLPKQIADLMMRHPRLNGIGPSRYAEGSVLESINISINHIEVMDFIPFNG